MLDIFDVLIFLDVLDLLNLFEVLEYTTSNTHQRQDHFFAVHKCIINTPMFLSLKFLLLHCFNQILSLYDSQISGETIHCCNTYTGILTPQGDVYVWGRGAKVSDCTCVDTAVP